MAVIGYGNIGAQVGILAEAMGMRVVFYDIRPRLSIRLGHAPRPHGLEDALAQADVVTLHVPATPQTRGLLNARALSAMKRGAILLNASRGTVVDIPSSPSIWTMATAGAAIDVFPEEPRRSTDPFVAPLQGKPTVILDARTWAAAPRRHRRTSAWRWRPSSPTSWKRARPSAR